MTYALRLAVLAALLLCATAAQARMAWTVPGREPFRGSIADAERLFVENGFPATVVDAQFRQYRQAACKVRPIGEGEVIDAMTFGADHLLREVVAMPALWPPRAPRDALECAVPYRGREYRLIVPRVCGNFSEEVVPLGAPAQALPHEGQAGRLSLDASGGEPIGGGESASGFPAAAEDIGGDHAEAAAANAWPSDAFAPAVGEGAAPLAVQELGDSPAGAGDDGADVTPTLVTPVITPSPRLPAASDPASTGAPPASRPAIPETPQTPSDPRPVPVPEPGSAGLLAAGTAMLALLTRIARQ